MYIGKQSIQINRAPERVYEIAETYPKFVSFFLDGSKILSSDDRNLLVEVHSRLLGLKTSWKGKGIKVPKRSIRFTQTEGLFRGLTARWSFVPRSDSETRVTICTSFRKRFLSPIGESFVGRFIVEKVTARLLRELKERSEAE